MSNEVVEYRSGDVSPIADDFLIQVAAQAEARIDAVMKIKRVALKVTNARDWTDQNGNPYLQVSGSEKIANLFGISWRIEEPKCENEPDGHFTYSIKGTFSLGGRTIEVEGTRSSKDTFFQKNDYEKEKINGKYQKLPISAIDRGDVKKAALTNLYGNGITRILGIRNLTWNDLAEFAEIKKEDVGKVEYKKDGEKPPLSEPQEKGTAQVQGDNVIGIIEKVETKTGTGAKGAWTNYSIHIGGKKYSTFDTKIGEQAIGLQGNKAIVTIKQEGKYWNCVGVAPAPAEDAPKEIKEPDDCTKQPNLCSHASFEGGKVICAAMNKECQYRKDE